MTDRQTDRQTDRIDFISVLSVISAFAVVSLHTNGCFWIFSRDRYWITANFLECFWYFAVPIFFMISGATLIDYPQRYDAKTYFCKRISKTFLPFVVWSMVGLAKMIIRGQVTWEQITPIFLFNGIFSAKFISIYWFFMPLFALYLSIPLLASVREEKKKVIFSYGLGIGFVFDALIPLVIHALSLPIGFSLHIDMFAGNLMFLFMGYLLSRGKFSKKTKMVIYMLAIVGFFVHLCGTYILSIEAGNIISTFKGYTNVPCLLYSAGIFLLIKEHGALLMKNHLAHYAVQKLAGYTFAVYLLHPFVMPFMVSKFHIPVTSIFYRVLGPVIIIFICIVITKFIRHIPFGERILP